jgi:hypothetical protein
VRYEWEKVHVYVAWSVPEAFAFQCLKTVQLWFPTTTHVKTNFRTHILVISFITYAGHSPSPFYWSALCRSELERMRSSEKSMHTAVVEMLLRATQRDWFLLLDENTVITTCFQLYAARFVRRIPHWVPENLTTVFHHITERARNIIVNSECVSSW